MTQYSENVARKDIHYSPVPRHIYLLITVLALLAMGGLIYSLYSGHYLVTRYNTFLAATQEIRHETTIGHLWLEEMLSEDETITIERVVAHYNRAYWLSQAMLTGDRNDEFILHPVRKPDLQKEIAALKDEINRLIEISYERSANPGNSGPGSLLDERYDAFYLAMLKRMSLLEHGLREVMSRQQNHFLVRLLLLIGAILVIAVSAFLFVGRFERRRRQAYVQLKEVQDELAASEKRYRDLVENVDLGIVMIDPEYRIVMANQAQASLFGLKREDIVGRKCHEVFFEKESEICVFCPNEDEEQNEEPFEKILEVERVDGKKFTARIKVFPVKSGNEKRGFVKVVEDITDRLRAEEALAEEKERLTVTLRSIGDGVITTDTAGKVTMMNKVAEDLTGWPQDEAAGRPLSEVFRIINELTRVVCENPVEKVLSSGRIVGLANHTALISRDGIERTIADSGSPIRDRQSRIIGVVLVFRDVTQQLRMEKEMTKVKKLESIGVLAGGIAHDFNNILAGILGNLNLALFDRTMEKETRKLLSEAEKASVRAKSLTAQLLTFSQGGDPVKETSSLEEVVRDSAEFILRGDRVAYTIDSPENLWLVDIDKGQISQVIQNLILNASHAMPEGGTIEIVCENIETIGGEHIFLASDQKYVKIAVSDHGVGIPENFVDKIFDPYFSTKQEGSGLGLPISYSIINKHGGHILVDSKPGAGTTFTIYLPASMDMYSGKEEEDEGWQKVEHTARIMVMDDEEIIREMSKAMLRRLGHEVLLVKDGREAIDLYREQKEAGRPVDLIIMDLTIPGGMGGSEAVKEILAMEPEARIVVSSGYSNDPVMANYRDYGFKSVIFKPYKMQELRKVVNQVLF